MIRNGIILFCLLISFSAFAQKQQITIEHADKFSYKEVNGVKLKMLVGNVALSQKDITLYCDSAKFYDEENRVDAFGNVHIKQSDSVDVYGQILKYDGNTKKAVLKKEAYLTDNKMSLSTDTLYYDIGNRVGKYLTGAHLDDGETKLFSRHGYYYANSDDAYFKDSVVLTNPKYTLTSDTLQFNSKTHRATFLAPTKIVSDTSTILCSHGWYDTEKDIASLGEHTTVINKAQTLKTDSLYYDRIMGFGKAMKNVIWVDTIQKLRIDGPYVEFHDRNGYLLATQCPLLTNFGNKDSLFLSSDTLKSSFDSTAGYRTIYAYHDVKIYKEDLQGVSDSLVYSYKDSVFYMYHNPVLWNEATQLKADTILIRMKHKSVDEIDLKNSAFISSQTPENVFNQIKGRHIYGYFENDELKKMYVEGNGESIYYGQSDNDAYLGVNKASSSNMWIYLKEKKVDKINFINQPDATFSPMQQIDPKDFILKDFIWEEDRRPKSKQDLIGL